MKSRTLYITYMGLTEPLLHSQVLSYLKILSQKGVSVHILSYEKKQFLTKANIYSIKQELDAAGIKWSFLHYHKRFQFLSKPYDVIKGMFFTLYIALKERIDVIHARGAMCALIGIMPHLFLRRRLIFDMRGLMAEEYVDAGSWKRKSFIYRLVNSMEQYFVRNADEVIVLTDKAKDLLIERHIHSNITVIPSCVDLGKFNFKKEKDIKPVSRYLLNEKFILIYTGSLGTWYMLSEMIDFYKQLLGSGYNAAFFILSQTERKWIEQHISEKLRKKVIIDFAKPKDVTDFLNLADVGIFFIKPCLSKLASCPTKFGEYLACGLPVIINKGIGDTEEIVRENRIGVVVENFSAGEYRRRIDEMKELLKEGEDLRKRCRSTAEKYLSLREGAGRYADVYARLED